LIIYIIPSHELLSQSLIVVVNSDLLCTTLAIDAMILVYQVQV